MSRMRALGRSSVGKKAISAVSGLVLLGYVLVHTVANLQIFAGDGRLDAYARGLRASPVLLWSVRALLAAAFAVHVVVALQLAARRRRAVRLARPALSLALSRGRERGPEGVFSESPSPAVRRGRGPGRAQALREATRGGSGGRGQALRAGGFAARGMLATGLLLAAFVVVHLCNLTWGIWHPGFVPHAVRDNVVALFRVRAWSAFYLVALAALALHAAHGAWSAPQSLGLTPERGAPGLRRFVHGAALVVAAGLCAVVVAAAAGGLR